MDISFTDKVALVTGAGAGMGLATAWEFARQGAAVALADIDLNAADAGAKAPVAEGHQAIGLRCDVADEDDVAAAVARTVEAFGRLDAAYNNAGVQTTNIETADADGAEFERVVGINQRGVWNCMKHELLQMRTQPDGGAIVNCASIGGLVGIANLSIYHGTKHAVIGMTKSTGLEYASRGIRINAVGPGVIETPMVAAMTENDPDAMRGYLAGQPIGRLGQPEEIANAVVWLASPAASFVVGHALTVDGGYTAA